MTFYDLFSTIMLVVFLLVFLRVIIRIVKNESRQKRIQYIRNYKKGNFLVIYPLAIPMFTLAYLYNNGINARNVFEGILQTIDDAAGLVGFKFNFSDLRNLMEASIIYTITVYFCYSLVLLNALLFFFSLFHQFIWEKIHQFMFRNSKRNRYLIVGENENSRALYKSIGNGSKAIVDSLQLLSKQSLLYELGIVSFAEKKPSSFICKVLGDFLSKRNKRGFLCIIVNTDDIQTSVDICEKLVDALDSIDNLKTDDLYKKVMIYVYTSGDQSSLYSRIANSYGCIQLVDKYKLIAFEFVRNNPLPTFLSDKEFDFKQSLLKRNVDISVFFVGFGKVNQEIFKAYVSTNQFVTKDEGNIAIKPVHYFIFDNKNPKSNRDLTFTYNRYEREFYCLDDDSKQKSLRVKEDDYLPLPSAPAETSFFNLDIDSEEFYACIKEKITANPKSINVMIVSIGKDYENQDIAFKLESLVSSWSAEDNTHFYVRKQQECDEAGRAILPNCDKIIPFGEVYCNPYDFKNIQGDDSFKLALDMHKYYSIKNAIQRKKASTIDIYAELKDAEKYWYVGDEENCTKSKLYRDSSLYQALSIRSKLLMLGMDVCKKNMSCEATALTKEEYMRIYADGDCPSDYINASESSTNYTFAIRNIDDIRSGKRPNNMAIQEHLRWNAYMICQGFVPENKNNIGESKKDYLKRYHACLTTYEGLLDYRKMVSELEGISENEADVIKYDYTIMDDAWSIMNNAGYQIVLRK